MAWTTGTPRIAATLLDGIRDVGVAHGAAPNSVGSQVIKRPSRERLGIRHSLRLYAKLMLRVVSWRVMRRLARQHGEIPEDISCIFELVNGNDGIG